MGQNPPLLSLVAMEDIRLLQNSHLYQVGDKLVQPTSVRLQTPLKKYLEMARRRSEQNLQHLSG